MLSEGAYPSPHECCKLRSAYHLPGSLPTGGFAYRYKVVAGWALLSIPLDLLGIYSRGILPTINAYLSFSPQYTCTQTAAGVLFASFVSIR